MNHNTLEDFLVILGNNNLWKKYEKEEIIQARIQLCMSKRQKKKQMDGNAVVMKVMKRVQRAVGGIATAVWIV